MKKTFILTLLAMAFSLPLSAQENSANFINYIKTVSLKNAVRSFPISSKDGACAPAGIAKTRAAAGGSPFEQLEKAKDIDGITRIDESTVKNTNCFVYLPKRFLVSDAAEKPGETDLTEASYMAGVLLKNGASGDPALAKDLIDNFIYESENYGYPIGSNRGYALTRSRSNIIPTNILDYFEKTKNYSWLENTGLPFALKTIDYWKTRIGSRSLDEDEKMEGYRWFAHGKGPRPEAWGTSEKPDPYYYKILYNLITLALISDPVRVEYAKGFDYNRVVHVANNTETEKWQKQNGLVSVDVGDGDPDLVTLKGKTYVLKSSSSLSKQDEPAIKLGNIFYTLTPKYYSNDRAAAVSPFGPSHVYGPYNAFVDEFIDAAHNLQLYRAMKDIAKMYQALAEKYENAGGKTAKTYREKVELYESEADEIKKMLLKYLWNEELGSIFNYSFYTHSQRSAYPTATAGYALWAGFFDPEKPEEVKMLMRQTDYLTKNLEGRGGYYATGIETGLAGDRPYVDAVQNGMILEGLKNYAAALDKKGLKEESAKLKDSADRVSEKYLSAKTKE